MREREPFLIVLLLTAFILFGVGRGVNASDSKNIDTGQMLKFFQEWQESKHPSTRLIYSGDIKLPDDAMCLVCHDSAGFLQWAQKGFYGQS